VSYELADDFDQPLSDAAEDELDGLHFAAVIGGRRLYFAAIPSQSRFRITMARAWELKTEPLGSVIRLDTDEPGLRVCAPLEVEWADKHAEKIISEAVSVWRSISRDCEADNGKLEAGRRTAVGRCADLFIMGPRNSWQKGHLGLAGPKAPISTPGCGSGAEGLPNPSPPG
jgi:hypothetical protein